MPPPIKVELVPHSTGWAQAAVNEAARIREAIGSNIIAVHHVGSTSIPGIHAKPILDLIPEVQSLAVLDSLAANLKNLGYEYWGEYGMVGRRYCTLDDASGQRRCQLHCFEIGHPQIERHLAFRDFLRANADKVREYEADKLRCRQLHPDDSHDYSDAKAEWIETHLPIALAFAEAANRR